MICGLTLYAEPSGSDTPGMVHASASPALATDYTAGHVHKHSQDCDIVCILLHTMVYNLAYAAIPKNQQAKACLTQGQHVVLS